MVERGKDFKPCGDDGPTVKAAPLGAVRERFFQVHYAEGTDEQKKDARKKAFKRAMDGATSKRLVVVQEFDVGTMIWFADQGEDPQ